MAGVSVEIEGLAELRADIKERQGRLKDLRPAMKAGAEAVLLAVEDRFRTETDFEGKAWPPLTLKTHEARKAGKILQQTRILANSNWAKGDKTGISFGNVVVYAATHHYGDPRSGRKIPRRSFFPVSPSGQVIDKDGTPGGMLVDEISETIADYVDGDQGGPRRAVRR